MAPARIDVEADRVGQREIVVPAEREILGLALVIVVALGSVDIVERRRGREAIVDDDVALGRIGKAEREFDPAQVLRFLEMRIERVEGRMEAVRWLPLDRGEIGRASCRERVGQYV